jgi:hypothetical protein
MDIVEKLREAVKELPNGEHSPGLTAIVRHVEAAIRHYDRADVGNDEEAFTDCIYRTNQVYEGSLKEAYRILSGQAVSQKTTLFEIEQFFDGNDKIRSRVLKQMSRYREDYRNPSTHDYKLDFDENEALLAILSVCAFAKLLVARMKTQLESDSIRNDPEFQPKARVQQKSPSVAEFAAELAVSLHKFLNDDTETANLSSREPLALVSAFLEKSGLQVVRDVYMQTDKDWFEWDMIVSNKSGFKVPIEVKTSRGRYSPEIAASRIAQVRNFAIAGEYSHALLVEGAGRGTKYVCEKVIDTTGLTLHRIGRALDGASSQEVALEG